VTGGIDPAAGELRRAVRDLLARRHGAAEETAADAGPPPGRESKAEGLSGSLLSRVQAGMAENGMRPEDGLYPILSELAVLVEKVAAGTEALNESVRTTADEEAGRIAKLFKDLEAGSADRLAAGIDRAVAGAARRLHWRMAAAVGGSLFCVALLAGYGGYLWGRADSLVVEGQLGAAFQDGPDAARIWLRLWRENNPAAALERCAGAAGFERGGRRGCWVPLWLEPAPVPQ
jgi:hypothetical protein